jgi:hypothetical protein
LKAFRIAHAATGVGLLGIGLIALVENFDKVKRALENSIPGFKQVSNAIGGVVDTIKEWIGASEEADRAASAFDAAAKKQRAASDATVERIERQIDIEKSAGRSTVALEIQREQAVINANRAIIADYVKKAGTLSQLSDEEKAKAKEVNDEAVKAVFDASARIIIIRNEAEREATEKALEQAKKRAQLELEIKKASNESIAKLEEQNTEFSTNIRLQLEKEYQEELKKLAEEKKKRDEEIARSFENINEELLDGQINRLRRLEAEEGSTSERRIQLIELESKKQINAIRLTVDDKAKADNQILLIEAETQQAIRDERKKSRDEAIDDAFQVANAVAGTLNKIIELQAVQSQNRIDQITSASDAEKLAIEQSTASEVNKQRQLDALQLRTNQKIAAEKTKQAEAAKALALFNAIIGTAQSVASAGNPVLAAIQLAAGLAQIAIIRAQPIPKFKKGGEVGGKSHEAGGTLIEAEKGEYVVNKTSVSQHRKALDAMNTSSAAFKKFIDEKYVRPAIAGYAMNNKRDGITVNASLNSKSMERKLDKLNKTMAGKQMIVNINGSDSRYSWQQN